MYLNRPVDINNIIINIILINVYLKKLIVLMITVYCLSVTASAETASNDYIFISMDIPEYVTVDEPFFLNLSIDDSNKVYEVGLYTLSLDGRNLFGGSWNWWWVFDYEDMWDKTFIVTLRGGVGGVEFTIPEGRDFNTGQTIPIKFKAQKVTHEFYFDVMYYIRGYPHPLNSDTIGVASETTIEPIYDPSVTVTVTGENGIVYEAISGKGSSYIRFSDGNDKYISNWDTSGNLPGEYMINVSFDNGYCKETSVLLH